MAIVESEKEKDSDKDKKKKKKKKKKKTRVISDLDEVQSDQLYPPSMMSSPAASLLNSPANSHPSSSLPPSLPPLTVLGGSPGPNTPVVGPDGRRNSGVEEQLLEAAQMAGQMDVETARKLAQLNAEEVEREKRDAKEKLEREEREREEEEKRRKREEEEKKERERIEEEERERLRIAAQVDAREREEKEKKAREEREKREVEERKQREEEERREKEEKERQEAAEKRKKEKEEEDEERERESAEQVETPTAEKEKKGEKEEEEGKNQAEKVEATSKPLAAAAILTTGVAVGTAVTVLNTTTKADNEASSVPESESVESYEERRVVVEYCDSPAVSESDREEATRRGQPESFHAFAEIEARDDEEENTVDDPDYVPYSSSLAVDQEEEEKKEDRENRRDDKDEEVEGEDEEDDTALSDVSSDPSAVDSHSPAGPSRGGSPTKSDDVVVVGSEQVLSEGSSSEADEWVKIEPSPAPSPTHHTQATGDGAAPSVVNNYFGDEQKHAPLQTGLGIKMVVETPTKKLSKKKLMAAQNGLCGTCRTKLPSGMFAKVKYCSYTSK